MREQSLQLDGVDAPVRAGTEGTPFTPVNQADGATAPTSETAEEHLRNALALLRARAGLEAGRALVDESLLDDLSAITRRCATALRELRQDEAARIQAAADRAELHRSDLRAAYERGFVAGAQQSAEG